ncbi:MAG: hypothetical protein IBJ03_13660 [Gemmatimonadaceae bacterium]|nr:hypothetical protein [Gemmatimonadaceae bacterium]
MRAARRVSILFGVVAISGATFGPASLAAQTTTGSCVVTPAIASGADACQKARDLFAFVMPQAGVALSGGNPVLGEGGTMGGWGKRAISARLTAVQGQLPRNTVPLSVTGASSSDFGAENTYVPVPSVDAAIGLFAGVPAGLTNVGGVDVLLGVTYLPDVSERDLRFAPKSGSFALSYGLRLGLLQESSLVPGISVSAMRRKLPTVALDYRPGNDSLSVGDLAVTSNTYRLVASKRFTLFGLAAGVGRDEIESTAGMYAVVNETVAAVPVRSEVTLSGLRNEVSRNTAFVNASFGLSITRIVAEYGWSSKGTIDETVNQFGGKRANDAYRYASLGVTVRF